MRALPVATLTRFRRQAELAMFDTCQRLVRTAGATDNHGKIQYAYTSNDVDLACGIKLSGNREVVDAGKAIYADYQLRLPHGTTLGKFDRIRLTKWAQRPGLAAIDCDIVGVIDRGPTAVTLFLKEVIDGEV